MEESAHRRERLKLMRLEASQEAATYNDDRSATSLSNPFLESTTNPESQVHSFSQSFNYYTNPMAAYSGNNQSRHVSPQISHDYSSTSQRSQTNETLPSPSIQPHIKHLPNPQMQQPQGQYVNPHHANLSSPSCNRNSPYAGGYRGPGSVGFLSPQTHFTSSPGHGSGQGSYPSPRFTNNPGLGSGRGFTSSPGHGSGQGSYPSPRFTNNPGLGSGRGYPSPGPNFMNSPNHGSSQGGYPSSGPNQGRGHWSRNNMSTFPSSGREMGRGSGQGRGRGRGGTHNHVSAEDRPDRFFNKSMVEDPWKFLEPVIWKSHKKQWLSHSLGAKKPRVSESPKQSSSQLSLAEILAASFNEATNDEPNAE